MELDLRTVSIAVSAKAGHKIKESLKCYKISIVSIFLKDFIKFARVFRDFC